MNHIPHFFINLVEIKLLYKQENWALGANTLTLKEGTMNQTDPAKIIEEHDWLCLSHFKGSKEKKES